MTGRRSLQLAAAASNRRGGAAPRRSTISGMRYDVLLECHDRPHPLHLATIHAADDDQARRLVAEKWPGEPGLLLVRVDGGRVVWLAPRSSRRREDRGR
jgi:hypothetical protein